MSGGRALAVAAMAALSLSAGGACVDDDGGPPASPDAAPDAAAADAAADTTPDRAPSDGAGPPADAGLAVDGGGDTAPPAVSLGQTPFTVVVLPDTQFYAQSYPDMFEAQTRWIAAEARPRQIAFVLHEGDIVETPGYEPEWALADRAFKMLDGLVPYFLAAGNHDIIWPPRQAPLMNRTFPAARLAPHLRGTFEPGDIQNAHYVARGGDVDWVVLALEFGPRNEVLAWASDILQKAASSPAMIVTHAHMYIGSERYDRARPMQNWNPHGYGLPGSVNDGQEIYQKLVAPNPNVKFVFSGHATWPEGAVGRLTTRRADGGYVHELLANYQGCPVDALTCVNRDTMRAVRGGEGFLRILRLEPAMKRATVETYSPFLQQVKGDPQNQFELPLE
jgi:hypothetical protein